MRKSAKSTRCKSSPPAWHADFEPMVPRIEHYARIAFRHLNAEAREEAIQETVCNACQAYARLVASTKTAIAFPSVLARFGIRQTRDGRRVGGKLNCLDVLSEYGQRKKGMVVERLDRFDHEGECWEEALVEDRRAGPAETAITRIDFSTWLELLPGRLRRIANFLAQGESTRAAAKRFRVSQSRVSQLRRQLYETWHRFQESLPALAGE